MRAVRKTMSPRYLLKRLALIFYTLFVVSLVVFAITQVLPADAAVMLLGENATPDALAAIREKLGLDQPVWVQYGHWLWGVLQGDFGISLRTGHARGARPLAHPGGPGDRADAGAGVAARDRGRVAAWQARRPPGQLGVLRRRVAARVRDRDVG